MDRSVTQARAKPSRRARHSLARLLSRTFVAAWVVTAVAGCQSLALEIEDFGAGWRVVEIVEVGSANSITRKGLTDCRDDVRDLAAVRFAAVRYAANGRIHIHIVQMDESAHVRPGDRVRTNVLRCGSEFSKVSPQR